MPCPLVHRQKSRQEGEDADKDTQRAENAVIRLDRSEACSDDDEDHEETKDEIDAPADGEAYLNGLPCNMA